MTSSLARLLRRSISNDQEVVTIGEEIEYTEAYLTIQKMRYQDKLEYEIDAEEDIRAERVIKLILQPLVENAIYHGIVSGDTAAERILCLRSGMTAGEWTRTRWNIFLRNI